MTQNNPDGVSLILKRNEEQKQRKRRQRRQRRMMIITVCLVAMISAYFYYCSAYSRINYIVVSGNDYLTREEILDLAGISDDDLFLLTFSDLIVKRIETSPYVAAVTVTKTRQRNVIINVTEHALLGYTYLDEPYLVVADVGLVELTSDKLGLISDLPLIYDFSADEITADIAPALMELDADILSNITEIHRYTTSYDENMLKITMNDGNKIFTGLNSITAVNNYFTILKALKNTNSCIYIDESTQSAYSSECPAAASETTTDTD